MAFDAAQVCNNILTRAFNEDIAVSPMKLQKILYFTASEYAKKTGNPLLIEPFLQWQYGPVVASVYSEFKPFRGRPIHQYAKNSEGKAYTLDESKNPKLRDSLNSVWAATKGLSAVALSRITHLEGSAWRAAFDAEHRVIDDDDVKTDVSYREPLGINA